MAKIEKLGYGDQMKRFMDFMVYEVGECNDYEFKGSVYDLVIFTKNCLQHSDKKRSAVREACGNGIKVINGNIVERNDSVTKYL